MSAALGLRSPFRRVLVVAVSLLAAPLASAEDRSIDGSGNNLVHPEWGSAGARLLRIAPSDYADGIAAPSGADRPGPRLVSNACGADGAERLSARGLSAMLAFFGQFIDHDLDLTPDAGPETILITVPAGDPWFDPGGDQASMIPMRRSLFDPATGGGPGDPREQVNVITAYLDGSVVYGSDPVRAAALRALDGTGRLKTSAGDLPPWNEAGLPNAQPQGSDPADYFLAGDVRANENCALTALHTLFLREHNRICDELAIAHPEWTGEERYQRARRLVGATIQAITFEEFLPALLGPGAVPAYAGYDPAVNAGIANEFQTGAYRLGHSLINEVLLRCTGDGTIAPEGNLALRDAFFAPQRFIESDPGTWLLGATMMPAQEIDAAVTSSLRSFLFGAPGAGGFDLFALNVARGRDHGLPGINAVRVALGLPAHATFGDFSDDSGVVSMLAAAYDHPDDVDLWVGGLAEDHVPGGSVGETLRAILVDQFARVRDGDRFWYEQDPELSAKEIAALRATRLADLIDRHFDLPALAADVFFTADDYGALLADLDLDGRVDFADLLILLGSWGPYAVEMPQPRADIDGDGAIGFDDLLQLLGRWMP